VKRIPSGLAIAALVPAAAGALALSIFAGETVTGELTRAIVLEYRLPRGILAFLVGASLGASGVCFQGLFRNSLADPFVVGVSSGAALGAVLSIVLGIQTAVFGLAPATATGVRGRGGRGGAGVHGRPRAGAGADHDAAARRLGHRLVRGRDGVDPDPLQQSALERGRDVADGVDGPSRPVGAGEGGGAVSRRGARP
jgi:hypothetical protein